MGFKSKATTPPRHVECVDGVLLYEEPLFIFGEFDERHLAAEAREAIKNAPPISEKDLAADEDTQALITLGALGRAVSSRSRSGRHLHALRGLRK